MLLVLYIIHFHHVANELTKFSEQPKKKRGRPAGATKKDAPAQKPVTAPKKPRGAAAAKKKAEGTVEDSGEASAEAADKPADEVAAEGH